MKKELILGISLFPCARFPPHWIVRRFFSAYIMGTA